MLGLGGRGGLGGGVSFLFAGLLAGRRRVVWCVDVCGVVACCIICCGDWDDVDYSSSLTFSKRSR